MSVFIHILKAQPNNQLEQVKQCLAQYVPGSFRVEKTAKGKPYLCGHGLDAQFSVSHSGNLLCVAINLKGEIGVDIEYQSHLRPCMKLARRFFANHELQALATMSPKEQIQQFYALWTLKEAMIKLEGSSVLAIQSFVVDDTTNLLSNKYTLSHRIYGESKLFAIGVASYKPISIEWIDHID